MFVLGCCIHASINSPPVRRHNRERSCSLGFRSTARDDRAIHAEARLAW